MTAIQTKLFALQDLQYKDFTAKLIPSISKDLIIGVSVPKIKNLAKNLLKEEPMLVSSFVKSLPHLYHEENFLHILLLNQIKDFDVCYKAVNTFLPFINNWAICDSLRPAIFKKSHKKLLPFIQNWVKSSHNYTIRFGIECLMVHFLDADFKIEYLHQVRNITSEEYYVKMMQAWFFATALAKQYTTTLVFLRENPLEHWTYNKALQKSLESYRIPKEHKAVLKQMKKIGSKFHR